MQLTSLTIAKKDNSDTKNPSDNKKPDTNTNTSGNGANNSTTTANAQVKAPGRPVYLPADTLAEYCVFL